MSQTEIVPSFCRLCQAFCPVLVTVEDGRAVKVVGDPAATEYEGYTCPKGRALPQAHNDPKRLLHSLRRRADGSFEPIESHAAADEIADKLKAIIDRHGPRSVALYFGGGILSTYFAAPMAHSFFRAIKSPMMFTPATIDKPAEKITMALHGNWIAGAQSFASSDVWMIVGANPIISKSNGAPYNNPGMRLKQAVNGGMKLIVIDPRRTETTKRAHVHLQARPGEDPAILAGIIHIIIAEELYDRAFLDENAVGYEELKAAVAPFTPAYVAERAGISVEDLLDAARTFGRGKRGGVMCSTGPSFSMHSNVAFYLALCLNTLCGRWTRAGEIAPVPNVLLPAFVPKAQPQAPYSPFGATKMRVKDLQECAAGLPTSVAPDEMLLEGDGQIKALINVGGNPLSAWPDERKTEKALKGLELLVQMDVVMSATAKLSHYVIAGKMGLEVPCTSYMAETLKYLGVSRGVEMPRAQYTPAIVQPPAGSDLVEEHAFFFRMAQRMGLQLDWINYHGLGRFEESPAQITQFDMSRVPTLDELWDLTTVASRVPLSEVKKYPHGHVFDISIPVAPKDADCQDKLQIGDPMMMAELAEVYAERPKHVTVRNELPFQLVTRRNNRFLNSILIGLPVVMGNKNFNPTFVNPTDLAALGLKDGDVVKIRSQRDEVLSVVESDDTLRPGVVSMTHGFGAHGREYEKDPRILGTNINLLIPNDEYDPISGIPRMSAIPVAIERADLPS